MKSLTPQASPLSNESLCSLQAAQLRVGYAVAGPPHCYAALRPVSGTLAFGSQSPMRYDSPVLALVIAICATSFEPIHASETPESSVCKAGIATIMGRPPAIMSTRQRDRITLVSYTRNDGNSYTYKCRVEGRRIHWGNSDGRWRTHPADSKLFFRVQSGTVHVEDRFSDGSIVRNRFELANLDDESSARAAAAPASRRHLVREIQERLKKMRIDAGPVDGVLGGQNT